MFAVATCIGCGCDDYHACWDEEARQPCSWLRLDRNQGQGSCLKAYPVTRKCQFQHFRANRGRYQLRYYPPSVIGISSPGQPATWIVGRSLT